MTVFASISELRLMDLAMAGDTVGTRARRARIALVVTGLALRLGMARGEAKAWMVAPDVGDLRPVGFIVARGAFGAGEPAFVGILVAGHTVGLQPEKRRVTATVAAIVAVLASNRCVRSFERPARLAMIETRLSAARPPHELRFPSEMLDMALRAVLATILASVKTRLLPDSHRKVVVARETSVGVDPLTRGMTLAAFRITLELGVGARELPRGQELGTGRPRHERASDRRHDHQRTEEHRGFDARAHSEKIQR